MKTKKNSAFGYANFTMMSIGNLVNPSLIAPILIYLKGGETAMTIAKNKNPSDFIFNLMCTYYKKKWIIIMNINR